MQREQLSKEPFCKTALKASYLACEFIFWELFLLYSDYLLIKLLYSFSSYEIGSKMQTSIKSLKKKITDVKIIIWSIFAEPFGFSAWSTGERKQYTNEQPWGHSCHNFRSNQMVWFMWLLVYADCSGWKLHIFAILPRRLLPSHLEPWSALQSRLYWDFRKWTSSANDTAANYLWWSNSRLGMTLFV